MISKRILVSALVLILFAGCGGSEFAQEKTVMTTATKAMETFNSAIGSSALPEDITKAVGSFSGALEKVLPKMKEMNAAHPDWETNPPEELKGTFDKFKAATDTFKGETMPKVMKAAQENADNVDLQTALKKFGSIVSQM